ncbi:DUF4202 domain-containing protein [Aquimarina agarilytica]|uniref:DUF4202 domain-containing protein n=1 Tax=Aquimarina agarilytica TaxID=1087449 RepID=UPI000287AE82|nr:DUF4202 domain-containing protein [Aquimarina agarilytica]
MNTPQINKAYEAFDHANSKDPNTEIVNNTPIPKELIYGQRMTKVLSQFAPNAPIALQLAARCQHICRWEIPRNAYEMNRVGYLTWRTELKRFHAKTASDILNRLNFDSETIERVAFLLEKKRLKKDADTQTLEDVICLVFLEYYYETFRKKHTDEKVIDIVQKTWKKMSDAGHEAALKINYSDKGLSLIQKALG